MSEYQPNIFDYINTVGVITMAIFLYSDIIRTLLTERRAPQRVTERDTKQTRFLDDRVEN